MRGFSLRCGLPLLLLLHAAAGDTSSSRSASPSASPPAASAVNTESTILTGITTPLKLENSSSTVVSKGTISSAMPSTLTSSTGTDPTSKGTPSTPNVMQTPTYRITTSTTEPCTSALGGGTCILVSRSLLLGLLFCILLTNMKH